MNAKELTKLGLTDAEARIYHTILKLNVCTVKDIAKECGFHRTNIYDVIEQLKEKGLVTFVKEGKVMKYQPADPHNFYELLKEKEDFLDSIFPELEKLHKQKTSPVVVEVYKGEEGMKSAYRDIVREKSKVYGFGIRGQLRGYLPMFAEQWLRDMKKHKIPLCGIYTQRKDPPPYITEIRYVSKELGSPACTLIYADKININIWEPSMVAIIIKSKLVADMYKKHFDLLWKIAKK
ncbi:hypothetical protein COV18_04750 [Candidatus Woesearchaeota archaeon CG10_big_fil_rev_8_21_14_0_10_37_12]|nr:MAG: hypothetical protein COV18_04750 [Candidatus Woesearchaeota archaeon CG10_big_fil_rev_8_21_14_0_10_37_12]